jgi:hypothetical protein
LNRFQLPFQKQAKIREYKNANIQEISLLTCIHHPPSKPGSFGYTVLPTSLAEKNSEKADNNIKTRKLTLNNQKLKEQNITSKINGIKKTLKGRFSYGDGYGYKMLSARLRL